jgi:Domain of unknown function (DUF4252)
MRFTSLLFLTLFTLAAAGLRAQDLKAQQTTEFIPHGIGILQRSASSKTDFTLDHSMLVLASKLEPKVNNDDLRRVIAGVSGISVHRYHYPASWQYDSRVLKSVGDDYRAAGWKQVMDNREKNGGSGVSDLWVRMQNNAISNVAMLLARSGEVNFIEVSGSISPLDLSHLGGHFGIPRIEGGVVVPAPERQP